MQLARGAGAACALSGGRRPLSPPPPLLRRRHRRRRAAAAAISGACTRLGVQRLKLRLQAAVHAPPPASRCFCADRPAEEFFLPRSLASVGL